MFQFFGIVPNKIIDANKGAGNTRQEKYKYTTKNQIIAIQSDGQLNVSDSLTPALRWKAGFNRVDIFNTNLDEFLNLDIFHDIAYNEAALHSTCVDCEYLSICGGGDLENRFSEKNGFDNPSIFCDGLKMYYSHVIKVVYQNPQSQVFRTDFKP